MRTSISSIVVLGNYTPRRCGIATFTTHLVESFAVRHPEVDVHAIAMSDRDDYEYPDRVRFEINASDLADYSRAARFINEAGYDVLSVQHEFGIFGGPAGDYLLALLREVKMPIVTTLHTVLREPDVAQKLVMDELLQLSERVVVMSEMGVKFLTEIYGLPPDRIDLIPHGIPSFDGSSGGDIRRELGIDGPMILTFGLLSPDKGVQFAIEAMPKVVEQFPTATYVVLGATHPHIRESDAHEGYRESLVALAGGLKLGDRVRFVDRFVSEDELVSYLDASDIYITPYLNQKQITSGTLAYAVGAGKAVISSPYWYAEELLAGGRGVLVPFRDASAISDAILGILQDSEACHEMRSRAREFGQKMLWPEVGESYLASFARAKGESSDHLRTLVSRSVEKPSEKSLPQLRLDHLKAMTDDCGLLQHATHEIPNRNEGYCVDDNARALILMTHLVDRPEWSTDVAILQRRYMAFVMHAFNATQGRFRNFMSYGRDWLEGAGSDDSHGRTLWALGTVVNSNSPGGMRLVAKHLFDEAMGAVDSISSPRTWAYTVLGANEYLKTFPSEGATLSLRTRTARRLYEMYQRERRDDWLWLENSLNYANARLPQAMILAGRGMNDQGILAAGLESLKWLMQQQIAPQGVFAPIGTKGYRRGDIEKPMFDQQPLEAWVSVSACISAAEATGDPTWLKQARLAFNWFLGENVLGESLCDKVTGGCRDGLHPERLNQNQGAESTLSYLNALIEMQRAEVLSLSPYRRADIL